MKPSLFLRAKHWQIFVPLLVIPLLATIAFMIVVVTTVMDTRLESPTDMAKVFYWMPLLIIASVSIQYLWQWNVAVNLRKYIRSDARLPRIGLFRFTFFLPLLVFCLMPLVMIGFFNTFASWEPQTEQDAVPVDSGVVIGFMLLMFFGQMVMLFCVLNNVYVISKTIKMAELQRKVVFADFAGDFFFIVFLFPVAIWFIQPRINAVVNADLKIGSSDDLLD